jgi:hypothetical protein
MTAFVPRRSDLIRRVQTAITRDEDELRTAEARRDFREIRRLTEDLRNRRAYLSELAGQRAPLDGIVGGDVQLR